MSQFWIISGTLIFGVVSTILVSHYYFRRSLNKSLTPYIQFSSSPLDNIDTTVRKDLNLKYRDRPIENLHEVQFLIANTGDNCIRDVIEPLSLLVPKKCELLDASILHISPKGRKVDLEISENKDKIRFIFPLLNSGEFFIAKVLMNGIPEEKEYGFSIAVDELPPVLTSKRLPYDCIATSRKQKFEFSLLIFGFILMIFGLAVSILIYKSWPLFIPSWSKLGLLGFFGNLGIVGWGLLMSILPALTLLLLGVMAMVSSFTEGNFPPHRKKFIVPDEKILLRWW